MNAWLKMVVLALGLAVCAAWGSESEQGLFDQRGTVRVPKTAGGKQWVFFSTRSVFVTDPVIGYFMMKREPSLPPHTVRYATLQQSASDSALIAAMGGEEAVELTITEVFALLRTQRGAEGTLRADGHENIAYVRDKNGVLRAVLMGKNERGWYLNARALDETIRDAEDMIFFPATVSVP